MDRPLLHIISHTDLDGVAAAALAWHVKGGRVARVSLTGYGEVDALILETLASGKEPLVLDLFCQKEQTIDEVDRLYDEARPPFLFDHHKSTFERYGNRKWAVIDTNYCGALVYWNWMSERAQDSRTKEALARLEPVVRIANDRDLWLGQIPESRLWQALVTMCGHWGMFARLAANPSAELTPEEFDGASEFTERQEARFAEAKEHIWRHGSELAFLCDGILEYGDVSDFCGLLLDRDENPPEVAAVAARRLGGDWAVSMRSPRRPRGARPRAAEGRQKGARRRTRRRFGAIFPAQLHSGADARFHTRGYKGREGAQRGAEGDARRPFQRAGLE